MLAYPITLSPRGGISHLHLLRTCRQPKVPAPPHPTAATNPSSSVDTNQKTPPAANIPNPQSSHPLCL